jgi:hypothetical protein
MGIWGLTKFCADNAEIAAERVCLTDLSAQEPVILVADGIGFVYEVCQKTGPSWEWAIGGEFSAMSAAIKEYVERLRKGGVELVVCLDPAEGVNLADLERKQHEHASRFAQ